MALPVRFANGFLIDQNTKARAFGDSQEASFRCQHFGIGDEAQQIVAHIIMDANRHLLNCDVGSATGKLQRSEEHTSELQSLMRISNAVFCLTKKNTHVMNYYKCTNETM